MTNPTHIKLLKRVLKNTTPDILSDYFQYKGGLEDLDLKLLYKQEKKKEVYYQEIQRNLGNLGEVQKGQILNEFQKVDFFLNSNNESGCKSLTQVIDGIIYRNIIRLSSTK